MMKRLLSDQRGVSLVEFAVVLPFLLTLYIGSYQVCDAISAYRKVTTSTRAVADLASQYTSVSSLDLATVLAASQQIMAPYQLGNAKLTVTQVKIDAGGNATVDWSHGLNVDGLTRGAAFTLPASIKVAGTSLIVASVDYNYAPVAASTLFGSIPMRDQIILSPRGSATIVCKDQDLSCK